MLKPPDHGKVVVHREVSFTHSLLYTIATNLTITRQMTITFRHLGDPICISRHFSKSKIFKSSKSLCKPNQNTYTLNFIFNYSPRSHPFRFLNAKILHLLRDDIPPSHLFYAQDINFQTTNPEVFLYIRLSCSMSPTLLLHVYKKPSRKRHFPSNRDSTAYSFS